jgi:hypothetical protein
MTMMTDEDYLSMRRSLKGTTKRLSHREELYLIQEDYTGKVGDYVQKSLMNRVSHIFQQKHKCTKDFSDWKVGEMTVSELQDVLDRQ